jgi:hypothetical protein
MTGPTAVTMEEIEQQIKAAEGTDLDKVKLEGDNVPEAFRGKTAAEVVKAAESAMSALKESEKARKDAEAARSAAPPAPVVIREEPKPAAEPQLSKEELAQLFESDPIAAVAYMNDRAMKTAEQYFNSRFGSLASGASSMAEQSARAKYSTEFELFGDEIKKIAAAIPDKSALGTIEGWDNLIGYVRGKGENFDKLLEHRRAKEATKAAEEARQAQEATAGFSPAPRATNSGSPKGGGQSTDAGLDDTERRIAQRFIDDGVFKDFAEYKKWRDL